MFSFILEAQFWGKRNNNNKKASPVYRNHHQFKEEIDKQQNLDKLF